MRIQPQLLCIGNLRTYLCIKALGVRAGVLLLDVWEQERVRPCALRTSSARPRRGNQLSVLQAERRLRQLQMKIPLDELLQPANRYQPVPSPRALLHRLFLLIFREPGDLQSVLQMELTFPKRFLGRLDQLIKLQPKLHIGGLFSHLAGENFHILIGLGQRQIPFGLFQGMHVFPLNVFDQNDLACIVVG